MKRLRLYHRPDCHLCEEMLTELEQLRRSTAFELEQIDVDGNATIRERYHARVPVLEDSDGRLLCEVFLDPSAVLNYLRDA